MALDRLLENAARLGEADRTPDGPTPGHNRSETTVGMLCRLDWQCERASHSDIRLLPELDLSQGSLPLAMAPALAEHSPGWVASHRFGKGELLADYDAELCFDIATERFNRRRSKHRIVEPRTGRFYPRGYIAGVRGIAGEEREPFRVGEAAKERLTVDLNHPLAGREATLTARILAGRPAGDGHRERCRDMVELVTANGPGMPARWREKPSDFWSDAPFSRLADEPDERFYSIPRLVQHLDAHCRAALTGLHADLIAPGSRVLDLMASWDSHLPDDLQLAHLVGLGMNDEELAANARLDRRLVHDVNTDPALPLDDASVDAVICTASVEYLTRPAEVFAELHRVLSPGGRVLMTFSDRWFPPKVIRIWQEMHPFERSGLVLDYLDNAGFTALHTLSLRGLPRPADDKYADRLAGADPLFAVWGRSNG